MRRLSGASDPALDITLRVGVPAKTVVMGDIERVANGMGFTVQCPYKTAIVSRN